MLNGYRKLNFGGLPRRFPTFWLSVEIPNVHSMLFPMFRTVYIGFSNLLVLGAR
jgi:hypothetical protein